MTKGRHSYIAFYASDWLAGTARMTRIVKSVYHDICLYNWDKAKPASQAEVMLMLADLEGQGLAILEALVGSGKLKRDDDGGIYNERAIAEAEKAMELWERKSAGGRKGAKSVNAGKTPAVIPENTPTQNHPLTSSSPSEKQEVGDASHPLSATADETDAEPPAEPVVAKPNADEPEPEKSERYAADMVKITNAWNAMAAENGLAQISKMTPKRITALRARIKDHGTQSILEAISRIPFRSHCMGQNDRGWKADFEFLVRPDTVVKINEGVAYKGKTRDQGWVDA